MDSWKVSRLMLTSNQKSVNRTSNCIGLWTMDRPDVSSEVLAKGDDW